MDQVKSVQCYGRSRGVLDLSKLTNAELVLLLQYHALTSYTSMGSLKTTKHPINILATNGVEKFDLSVTTAPLSVNDTFRHLHRVTALEARLEREYYGTNPSLSFAPLGSSSRFLLSVENITPDIIPPTVNLPQPGVLPINGDLLGYPSSGGLSRLLISTEETAPDILPTTGNLLEHRTSLAYPTISDYQAVLEGFLGGSSQVGYVAEVAESTNPDWMFSGYNPFNYSPFDLSTILNFSADDLQILFPFLYPSTSRSIIQ
ncbi:hypothetical protein LguiB_004323 [Lonicera macranthoides]